MINMEHEIEQVVQKHGWFGANINDHDPPFLYSIGLLQTFNHPEFIIFGLEPDNARSLFTGLIEQIERGRSFREPGVHELQFGDDIHRVGFRPVDMSQHPSYLGFAMGYCRHIGRWGELEAVQAFWPDQSGKFPFDVGCDLGVFQLQPRLDIPLTPDETEEFERQFS